MLRIDINFHLSKQFSLLLGCVSGVSLLIILTLPIAIMIKALLVVLTLLYSVRIYCEHGLRCTAEAIHGMALTPDGWVLNANSGLVLAEILGESTVTAFVSILRFQCLNSTQKRTCVVFNDALNTDDYRRLIVQLRTHAVYKPRQLAQGSSS